MNLSVQDVEATASRRRTSRFHASMVSAASRLASYRPMFRPFGVRESESAMQFASRGRLRCICMEPRVKLAGQDRRQVCRSCGLEASPESKQVNHLLTSAEIRGVVRSLQVAGIRSAQYELPTSITTLRQLNEYLAAEVYLTRTRKMPDQPISAPSQAS